MQSSNISPFLFNYKHPETLKLRPDKRYIHINIGKGASLFTKNKGTSSIINDTNIEVIQFYQNIGSTKLHDFISTIALNWNLIEEFSQLSSKEIYISYQDFENNIITLEDMQFMVRAIVLMNIDSEKFTPLFSQSFTITQDLFINSLIKSVVKQIAKIKDSTNKSKFSKSFELFNKQMEIGFKTGFFNHFQNIVNLQNTHMVDCIDRYKQLSFWYFLVQTSKGNKINYDTNGNIKSQYGEDESNKNHLKLITNQIKQSSEALSLQQIDYYHLPYSEFLSIVNPSKDDVLIADFRSINQIKSITHELKQNAFLSNVLNLFRKYMCQWMILIDNDSKIAEIRSNQEQLVITLYKENTTEFTVLSNI